MRIGIDASNIRRGGGVTHLVEILRAVRPAKYGIEEVVVWGGENTLDQLPQKDWLRLAYERSLDRALPFRFFWQSLLLAGRADKVCDILLVPGGTYIGRFRPFVAISQNLLPFKPNERGRFRPAYARARFCFLDVVQRLTFRRAQGVVFLTKKAEDIVRQRMGPWNGKTSVIPHGVNPIFQSQPRRQATLASFSRDSPFRWLYVSIIDFYKHQWNVVRAVGHLRERGVPVSLELVGPANAACLPLLWDAKERTDPTGEFVNYRGRVPHRSLPQVYREADAFVFASSCETFGQILLEAMASGLPIACSERSAMPEVLGEGGVYFNPESPDGIATAMMRIMGDRELRSKLASRAFERSKQFSWERTADETFGFIAEVHQQHQ